MKKNILLFFLLTFHLAQSQSTLITPNSGGNGNFLFKSTGSNYGQFSTTATGANLVFRVNEPAANNGTTGLITGAIYSDATRTVLAGFSDSGQLYGINKVEIGTNAVSNRMIMDANGNVGIGTTPFVKFHIKSINPNFTGTGSGITPYGIAGFESNIDAFINLMTPSAYQSGVLFGSPLSSVRGGIIYNNNSGGANESLALRTGGNFNRILIDKNGNVGIGDFMPTYKLDVLGSVRIQSTDFVMGPAAGRGNGGRALVLDSNNMLSINFANDFTGGTFINSNVGIGALPNSSYKLSINGTARSKEVIVETGWADYVFEEDYKLSSLSEVEQFIKDNKHLPDVPSAKEIQKNGAYVGELMTKMMQKIEELTLYTIEQERKMMQLQKDLVELKNRQ